MFNFWNRKGKNEGFLGSALHDETTFYKAFLKDLGSAKKEVIIESPFITNFRAQYLRPTLQKLVEQGVRVYIITRNPKEHEENLAIQAQGEIAELEMIGVRVLLNLGNHHRKLAILDKKILWEGSLNILSQTFSKEIMRRIENKHLAIEMFNFLKLKRFF